MATRRFWTIQNGKIATGYIDFKWESGCSIVQKRRSCENLHVELNYHLGFKPLDISSASTTELGKSLSAFNLKWKEVPLECWYQGSRVYKNAGVQHQLYNVDSMTAKKTAQKLNAQDEFIGFNLLGIDFPVKPKTLFYDWIYINALIASKGRELDLEQYDCFTDVQAVMNIDACQARSVCMYKLIQQTDNWGVLESLELFREWHQLVVEEDINVVKKSSVVEQDGCIIRVCLSKEKALPVFQKRGYAVEHLGYSEYRLLGHVTNSMNSF